MPLRSLHIDLNSFFASVEQQHDPSLRGKPVGIVPLKTEATGCIAASYQAKAFGVRTGTSVPEARRLCPGIILVPACTERYVKAHHAIIAAVDTVWPVHKIWSIDEIECRLTGVQQSRPQAERIARRIKRAILSRVGQCLTCSIGIAPNQLLAKLGSDLQKPDGLVIIEEHELPQRLYPLRLNELVGIGPRMEQRLLSRGVEAQFDWQPARRVELVASGSFNPTGFTGTSRPTLNRPRWRGFAELHYRPFENWDFLVRGLLVGPTKASAAAIGGQIVTLAGYERIDLRAKAPDDGLQPQHQRGVDRVLAGRAEMQPVAPFRRDRERSTHHSRLGRPFGKSIPIFGEQLCSPNIGQTRTHRNEIFLPCHETDIFDSPRCAREDSDARGPEFGHGRAVLQAGLSRWLVSG
mgnify:CR=1 FL=1